MTDPTKNPAPVDPDLEPVENSGFTEDDHDRLDAAIVDHFGLDEWTPSADHPIILKILYNIVAQLQTRAAFQSPTKLKYLSKTKPILIELLRKGSQEGFKSIRLVKIFWKDSPAQQGQSSIGEITSTAAARWAWDLKYEGQYDKILRNNIDALPRSVSHANCISIIQSSGYGKSRMVDELAKLVFTIPLNIRNQEESREGAYPPSDSDIWWFLCKQDFSTVDQAQKRVALFFGNLFEIITEEVRKTFGAKVLASQETFAHQWREYLLCISDNQEDNRSRLYKKVKDISNKWLKESFKKLVQRLQGNLGKLLEVVKKCYQHPPERPNCVKIILYFDEAHELGQTIGGRKVLYDAVWSVLAEFRSPDIFTIFLSTHSSMPLLAPSIDASRSVRQVSPDVLWGAVTETPFDCHPIFPLRSGKYQLAEVSQPEFIIKFGRPLFWTMFEHKKQQGNPSLLDNMMGLAQTKLLCHNDIFANVSSCSQEARTAILDILITYDYEPRRESSTKLEMKLVSSHMRTAFSIPYHRTYLRSGYPSEPFLAEAASRQMHHFMKAEPSFSMLNKLRARLNDGLIDVGQKGELVMRLLLRKAYMAAVIAKREKDLNFSSGCNFVEFLKALLAHSYKTEIKQLEPHNIPKSCKDSSLANVFKRAVVRFTHFVKAADGSMMTTTGMVMSFLRGAAIIGWNCQESVDIAIPILMDEHKKIEEASMSALLIQVKRRHQRGSPNAYIIDAEKMEFFTGQGNPYVTLLAELGAEPLRGLKGNVKFDEPPACHSPRKEQRDQEEPLARYSIRAYKCTRETWSVVSEGEDDVYKQIMGLDNLFTDHPRQDEASLDLIYRQLPSWSTWWFSESKRWFWFSWVEGEQDDDTAMETGGGHEDDHFGGIQGEDDTAMVEGELVEDDNMDTE